MGRAHAFQSDLARGHAGGWPGLTAARTAAVAQAAEVDPPEGIGGPATPTALGAGRGRHSRQRQRVVVHSEVQDTRALAAEIGDERVVRVEHEPRGAFAGDLFPALGDGLELAVAIELV